jgi:hypothetical protein
MEPVDLSLFQNHAKFSSAEDVALMELYISAAREMAENYTGRDFISRTKKVTYTIDKTPAIALASITSVSGFYNTVAELSDAYNYFNDYRKGIIINRDYPINYNNLPTYTITYNLVVNPSDVPAVVKRAILAIASDFYEHRESSSEFANKELSISHKTMLAPYRINL